MRDAFRVFWEALRNLWEELFLLSIMNIVTILLAIPVVTFPPALAGLWNAANRAADGLAVHWSDYFEGFRRYFWKAWALALLNILVIVITLSNIYFYTPGIAPFEINVNLSVWIRAFFLVITALWLIYQMYPLAMLLEQTDQRLRMALRNAAVLFAANPGFTIVLALLLLIGVVIAAYLVMPWVLFMWALLAVVCNTAVKHLLKPYREAAEAEAQATG
jgi:hypothetical protein